MLVETPQVKWQITGGNLLDFLSEGYPRCGLVCCLPLLTIPGKMTALLVQQVWEPYGFRIRSQLCLKYVV